MAAKAEKPDFPLPFLPKSSSETSPPAANGSLALFPATEVPAFSLEIPKQSSVSLYATHYYPLEISKSAERVLLVYVFKDLNSPEIIIVSLLSLLAFVFGSHRDLKAGEESIYKRNSKPRGLGGARGGGEGRE